MTLYRGHYDDAYLTDEQRRERTHPDVDQFGDPWPEDEAMWGPITRLHNFAPAGTPALDRDRPPRDGDLRAHTVTRDARACPSSLLPARPGVAPLHPPA